MYLHALRLKNVKTFHELDFEFVRPGNGGYAGLNVIVGGNASGKTTILRSIALALYGDTTGRQLIRDASGWISKGASSAYAEVDVIAQKGSDFWTSKGRGYKKPFPCEVTWTRIDTGNVVFSAGNTRHNSPRGPWNETARGWFAAGYGPMRRLTGASAEASRDAVGSNPVSRFISLFREDAALGESEIWLKNLNYKTLENDMEAQVLLEQIKDLMNDGVLPYGFQLSKIDSNHVHMRTPHGEDLPMRELSEGFRCVYALLLDIIRHMFECYGAQGLIGMHNGRVAVMKPGIVMIDELETHLHPSWQHDLCVWLKERFPFVQFIVTSHSPLIVQAADPGGIYFLPSPGESRQPHRFSASEYERIVMGRADKILLGEAFGLSHTRGAWAINQIERYEFLKAKKLADVELAPSEMKEFDKLNGAIKIAFEDDVSRSS